MNKKLLLVAAAAAGLMFTSCSQDRAVEVRQGNEIGFQHNLLTTTRGTETTLSNLGSFYVATPDQPSYFPGNYATQQGANWKANNSPVLWGGDDLDVYAYGPASSTVNILGGGTANLTSSAKEITGFKPVQAIKDQKDLVVATNIGVSEATSTGGVIPLNFNHELAQIKIEAKSDYTNYKVEVAGVKLVHFDTTGKYTFPTATSSASVRGVWSDLSGKPTTPSSGSTNVDGYYAQLDGTALSTGIVTLTSSPQSIMLNGGTHGAFIIPQNVKAWDKNDVANSTGAQIAVLLRISKNTAATGTAAKWEQIYPDPSISGNADKFAYSAVGVAANFEAGKVYTITLDILSSGAGAGTPPNNPNTPAPGNPGNDDTVAPNPGVLPGKPIVSTKEIEFGVTINAFDPASGISVTM